MAPAVMVLGLVAEAGAWWLVTRRGRSVWTTLTPATIAMGAAALAVDVPVLAEGVSRGTAAVAGSIAGVALYLATRGFVEVVARVWPAFARDSIRAYLRQGMLSVGASVLAACVGALGEELFWRGLFQRNAASGLSSVAAGAIVAWVAFALANAPSRNLAVLAGAVVGGMAWGALAWWTDGVLASMLCHGVWTGLMVAFPVVRAREAEPG